MNWLSKLFGSRGKLRPHTHVYEVCGLALCDWRDPTEMTGTCECGATVKLWNGSWCAIYRGKWEHFPSECVQFTSLAIQGQQ